MLRQALFYGTLGAIAVALIVMGYRDGSIVGIAQIVAGVLTTMLTLRLIIDEGREIRQVRTR